MQNIPAALLLSLSQLSDKRILGVLLKSIGVTLAIFAALSAGLWIMLDRYLARWLGEYSDEIGGLVTLLAAIIGGWLLFRVTALAVIQFFADDIILAVEARHYPAAAHKIRNVPWREEVANSAKGILRALLANGIALIIAIPLLLTAIGPAILFWAVNAWLLGRELQDMVWLRLKRENDELPPLNKATCFLFGGIIAALLAVPFLNLLAPIIGAAGATHLVHKRYGNLHE